MTRQIMAAAMSESQLQTHVIHAAKQLGWRVCHFRAARTKDGWATPIQGDKGFPDLVLARGGKVLLVELKAEKGKLADEQDLWAQALGPTYYRLWRPSDWQDGRIDEDLK